MRHHLSGGHSPNEEALVADDMSWHNGFLHWDVLFTRAIHDWDMGLYKLFLPSLFHQINRDGEDQVHWLPARSGSFEVKSFTSPYYPTDPSLPMEK